MKTDREQVIHIIRRKRVHKAHHGGAWKVAFADFMTAMMALFLVLWLITQSSEVRSAIAGYFQDPLGRDKEFGTSIMPGSGQSMMPTKPTVNVQPTSGSRDRIMQLGQNIQKALGKNGALKGLEGHVLVEMTESGMRISLLEDSTDVFFASGSPRPFPAAEELIRAIGRVLATADFPLVVEGHTDSHAYAVGGAYTNWELSADRANAARRLLASGGVPDSLMTAVRGLADRDPRIPEHPDAPQNRRITIVVNGATGAALP